MDLLQHNVIYIGIHERTKAILRHFFYFSFGLAHIGRVGSVLSIVMDTIERFIAVVFPLRRLKQSTSMSIIGYNFVIAILFNIPRFMEYRTIAVDQDARSIPHNMNSYPTNNKDLLRVGLEKVANNFRIL